MVVYVCRCRRCRPRTRSGRAGAKGGIRTPRRICVDRAGVEAFDAGVIERSIGAASWEPQTSGSRGGSRCQGHEAVTV